MQPSGSLDLDGDLDKELLAALDEVLSCTSPSAEQLVEIGCHLADTFAPGESPPLAATQLQLEQQTATSSPPRSHHRRPKDLRTLPYAKIKPRRKRPKDELDYLRAQVTNLQEELAKLSSKQVASDGGGDTSDELDAQWKKIAVKQKAAVDRSTVENLKLRSILEGQLKVAKSLKAVIQHQQQETAQLLLPHRAKVEQTIIEKDRQQRVTNLSDEMIFAQLNVGLDKQYAEFDTVMNKTGLSKVQQSSAGIYTIHNKDGIAFRHEEARLLPFAMSAVHRAMWSCVRYGDANNLPSQIHVSDVNNDHLNATIVGKVQLPKAQSVNTRARLAMHRHFEANRIVVVWSGYVEIFGSLFVRLREKGYCSASAFDFSKNAEVKKDDNVANDSSVPGCVFRLALEIKPEMDTLDLKRDAREHVGEMTDIVVGSYHRNLGLMYQVMTNLLLHDSTGGEMDEQRLTTN